jgi:hypothetical protein
LRINGADLPSAMLRSGDVVELGDVRLKFVPAGVEDVVTQASPAGARSVEAVPAGPPKSSGRGTMAMYGGAVVLLGAVIFLAVRPSEDTPTVTSVRVEAAETAEIDNINADRTTQGSSKILEEAQALAADNIVMAHRRLSEIPQDSTLRQTEAFRSIEQRWADEILKAAEESPDPAERRRLLDTVAKTPEVDAERRLKAAGELAKLDDEGLQAVDVADLPSADNKGRKVKPSMAMSTKAKPAPATTPRRARPQSSTGMTSKTQKVGVRPTVTAPDGEDAEENTKPAVPVEPAPPPPPKPAPKPQEPARTDSELTRDPPF